jgi:hypothetical protein
MPQLACVTADNHHHARRPQQRILQRWPDVVGEKLKTLPIDWHH